MGHITIQCILIFPSGYTGFHKLQWVHYCYVLAVFEKPTTPRLLEKLKVETISLGLCQD